MENNQNLRIAELRFTLKVALEAMEQAYYVMEDGHQANSKDLIRRSIERTRRVLIEIEPHDTAMDKWQPIKTAPKDRTRIILARIDIAYLETEPSVFWACSGYWSRRLRKWTDGMDSLYKPNFWIPLPEPPSE